MSMACLCGEESEVVGIIVSYFDGIFNRSSSLRGSPCQWPVCVEKWGGELLKLLC